MLRPLYLYRHISINIFYLNEFLPFSLCPARSNLIIIKGYLYWIKLTHNKQHFRYIALTLCGSHWKLDSLMKKNRPKLSKQTGDGAKHDWYLSATLHLIIFIMKKKKIVCHFSQAWRTFISQNPYIGTGKKILSLWWIFGIKFWVQLLWVLILLISRSREYETKLNCCCSQ